MGIKGPFHVKIGVQATKPRLWACLGESKYGDGTSELNVVHQDPVPVLVESKDQPHLSGLRFSANTPLAFAHTDNL